MQGQSLDSLVFGILSDHATEGLFTVHRQTLTVLSANQQLGELVGRSRQALVGISAGQLFGQERDDAVASIVTRAGLHEEVILRGLDDYPVWVDLTVAHIDHPELGPLAACAARDTTERRILERELIAKHKALYTAHAELERAVSELRDAQTRLAERNRELSLLGSKLTQAARRAALGEFSAGIAHSMNNPMGALSSTLRQLVRRIEQHGDDELRADLERFLRRCHTALARLERIVNAVRHAHRSGLLEDQPREVDLAAELDLALSLFEGKLGGITVTRSFEPGASRVWVLADALQHVISNLLDNAIRAMPEGGHLSLSIAGRGDLVVVAICDTGPGVPAEVARALFEPFVSTRPDGTGLGLATSQRLARQWGGDVVLVNDSRETRFEILIPRKEPS
jgi:signal transduction histidine kinase